MSLLYNEYDINIIYTTILSKDFINNSKEEIHKYISNYINILNMQLYKYKNMDIKKHLQVISYNIYSCTNYNNRDIYTSYIQLILKTCGCQKLLVNRLLNMFSTVDIIEFIIKVCDMGCINTLLVFLNYIDRKKIILSDETKINMILLSFKNSDDRIYKYITNIIKNNNFINIDKIKEKREDIIKNIFTNHIPCKYRARRLKTLSSIICIDDMIDHMILLCMSFVNRLIFVNKVILKYYLKSQILEYHTIVILSQLLKFEINNEPAIVCCDTYDILLKSNIININSYIITLFAMYKTDFELIKNTNNIYLPICIIIKLGDMILPYLYWISNHFNYSELSDLLSNNYSYNIKTIFQVLPFVSYFTEPKNIQFNKCLFILRTFIRKYKKKSTITKKIRITPLLHELINIKPTNKLTIMKDGTNFFKNKKQMFNDVPPYHIMPGQLNNIDGCVFFRMKADGILVNKLPQYIYPEANLLPIDIKAEYIENLDLYLVFDINLPNTIEERYNILRSSHIYTNNNNNNNNIESLEELYEMIRIEKNKLKKFLDLPYKSYRWYPKASWKIRMNKNIMTGLIDFLNSFTGDDNELIKIICNDIILVNDGIILTPLSGCREMKLKPKDLLSIDLLYKNKNWYDREGNVMNSIISNSISNSISNNYSQDNNTIWRCYPIKNNMYEPRDIRYDKFKPNNNKIISTIISLYSITYKYEYNGIYRSITMNQLYSNEWKKICKINNNIIKKFIPRFQCKNILDLGCGKGKIIEYVGNNFKNYYGIDLDVNMLAYAVNNYNMNNNIVFNNIDISKDWDQNDTTWINNNIKNTFFCQKYDTIFAINSLQYFNTDIFWRQLNNITEKNSMMLFNLVEMNNMEKYETETVMIKRIDNLINFQFKPVHTTMMSEPYIDNIEIILRKYGWSIVEKYNIIEPEVLLPKYYIWYRLIKN